ncbi:ribose import ATP-binding protein RbsA [Clostridia bacterium]|nr:ribose import ATP-binding protein RbsA [Clostridia bacterium]
MNDMQDDLLKIKGISKQYGVVKALDEVSFSVRAGEIHALLGENGAGKSTLVKIIMGEERPSAGSIELDGKLMEEFHPNYSRGMGIQMVHQELAVFENMSVTENLFPWMADEGAVRSIKWEDYNSKAQEILDSFEFRTVVPTQRMDTVNLAGQQMIEILRCIYANPKVLLLDEPTSGLNNEEAERLMLTLKELKAKGLTIIYISHRLNEILDYADRVTVMRDGKFVCTLDKDEMNEQSLINNMTGREFSSTLYSRKTYKETINPDIMFEVKALSKKKVLWSASLKLFKGEVLGVFGLEGSGTDRLSRMMYGLESVDEADIWFEGIKIKRITSAEMVKNGILYLNGNRKYAGLLHDSSVMDNISLPQLKTVSNKWTFIQTKKLAGITKSFIERFSIAIPSLKACPRNLSGGNQQKVMLATNIATNPKLLIVNEPTRGIDVGAKVQIHNQLLNIASEGVGIIVFSSELPELLSLSDRIIVMHEKRINGEISGKDMTEQSIMRLASVRSEEVAV